MNICLIGKNITNLLLAKNLDNKGINFELFYSKTNDLSKISTRTIGITEDNINFLGKNIKKNSWSIKDIKIYTESNNNEEIINFESKRGSYFSIVKYSNLFQLLEKDLKKSKNIKKFLVTTKKLNTIIKNKKYDLIINSDFKNQISKKYFYRKYSKVSNKL